MNEVKEGTHETDRAKIRCGGGFPLNRRDGGTLRQGSVGFRQPLADKDTVIPIIDIQLNAMIRQAGGGTIDGDRTNTDTECIGFTEEGKGLVRLHVHRLLGKRERHIVPKEKQLPEIDILLAHLKIGMDVFVEGTIGEVSRKGEGEAFSGKTLNMNGHGTLARHPDDFQFF